MAKNTVKLFFHIISSVLQGKIPNTEDFTDWKKLYSLASSQSCVPYLYYGLRDNPNLPIEIAENINKDIIAIRNQQAQQDYYAEQLFSALEEKGIDYAEMKGRTLRKHYPYPDLRSSCDIDFLYRKDKRIKKEVFKVIKDLGGKLVSSFLNDDTFNLTSVVTLEAHHSLMATDEFYDKLYQNIWERLQRQGQSHSYAFSPKELYLYCLIHAKKHFFEGGCGVRSIIDLWILKNRFEELNDQDFIETIKEYKGYNFEKTITRLADIWLNDGVFEEQDVEITKYIFQGGTLGSQSNQAVARYIGEDAKHTKRKYIMRKAFPPYKVLVKNYKILKPLPFLLPFVWVYRDIKLFFTKNKTFREDVKRANEIDAERVQTIGEIFKSVTDE